MKKHFIVKTHKEFDFTKSFNFTVKQAFIITQFSQSFHSEIVKSEMVKNHVISNFLFVKFLKLILYMNEELNKLFYLMYLSYFFIFQLDKH